jgi:hypothetical protein
VPLPNSVSRLAVFGLLAALCAGAEKAHAWGDEGHEIIGLIALHFLSPAVHARVAQILAGDDTGLVAQDLAHEATWADKYRDSDRDGARLRYQTTRAWHFVDLEIREAPDLRRACHGEPRLPEGTPASSGPPEDCVLDKIEEFFAELADRKTDERERRLALQFLLHFVGDLHQPLHVGDDHDQGGNRKITTGPNLAESNLHHQWDVAFVERLGPDSATIARALIAQIREEDIRQWTRGTPRDWALETYAIAKTHAYGLLPPVDGSGLYPLSEAYVSDATRIGAEALRKAGVRLASLLNQALH